YFIVKFINCQFIFNNRNFNIGGMMKYFICLCIMGMILGCAGERFLVGGVQIGSLWNGEYEEEGYGEAYLNVGNKEVNIRDINIIPEDLYYVDEVIQQKKILQVWLSHQEGYIAMQMTRVDLSGRNTEVFFNAPIPQKTSFPTQFDTNISMLRL
ncbi:MAG: hypothetical protein ACRC0X_04875, partial [Brevinema sp.]